MEQFDLDARYQSVLRATAGGSLRGYNCPVCSEHFKAGPRLWEHAKKAHGDTLGLTEDANEAGVKKEFLGRAQLQADKAGAVRLKLKHPSYNQNDYTDPQENEVCGSLGRPSSAPGYAQERGNMLQESEGPRLGQEKRTSLQGSAEPVHNTRKRGPGGDFTVPGTPQGANTARSMGIGAQHARTTSGTARESFDVESPENTREGAYPDDSEFSRGPTGPKLNLYDPNIDSTNIGKGVRREKNRTFGNLARPSQPPRVFSTAQPPFQPLPQQEQELVQRDELRTQPDIPRGRQTLSQNLINEKENTVDQSGEPQVDEYPSRDGDPDPFESEPEMLLQPETRPISHEQLVVEVKGIYAGLVMVEAKCIDIDERQSTAAQEKDPARRINLKNDQWQSLIALHKQLLHEHHDFFLASQHPSASPALSRLAAKYSMPARMWRHGIHAFLEVLRHRLPESLEHMLAFIYIAYSMMALLYETVSAFEDTWIECLGDLGRYRMAIEDDEPKDREVWSNVSRFWYNKASDKSPHVGRLYHHLAILARPYTWEQLSLYARSLTCDTPFESARGSIMTLFNPILQGRDTMNRRQPSLETMFIRAHAILFTNQHSDSQDQFHTVVNELERDGFFDNYIAKAGTKFKENGVYAAISNFAALFEYGSPRAGASKSILRRRFDDAKSLEEKASKVNPAIQGESMDPSEPLDMDVDNPAVLISEASLSVVSQASRLVSLTLNAALKRTRDKNVYPLVHVSLVFFWSLTTAEGAIKLIEKYIPWYAICSFLNAMVPEYDAMKAKDLAQAHVRLDSAEFPRPEAGTGRPLSEDFAIRGQVYTAKYYPKTWFSDAGVDDDERPLELPSMNEPRVERILWNGRRLADIAQHIKYDVTTKSFSTTDYVNNLNAPVESSSASTFGDIIMSDARPVDDASQATGSAPSISNTTLQMGQATPETASVAASESLDKSKTSTRASTPTAVKVATEPAAPSTPIAVEPGESIDTPMVDISPGKSQPQRASKGLGEPGFLTLSQNVGVSLETLPQVGKSEDMFPADPKKVQIMDRFDNPIDEVPQKL